MAARRAALPFDLDTLVAKLMKRESVSDDRR
jgi:hypothetical protein